MAGRAGNVDCWLWAILGLSDSLFLLGDTDASAELIRRPKKYVEAHIHPLESLHIELSLRSIDYRTGKDALAALDAVVLKYSALGITWPVEYVSALRSNDFTRPRKF